MTRPVCIFDFVLYTLDSKQYSSWSEIDSLRRAHFFCEVNAKNKNENVSLSINISALEDNLKKQHNM